MTPCEGSAELVDGNGRIAEISEFTDCMISLINDEDCLKEYAKASRKRIEEKFTWKVTMEQYLETLQSITEKK
jgi:glycosyltransferase involved in cell wall biosynthesis